MTLATSIQIDLTVKQFAYLEVQSVYNKCFFIELTFNWWYLCMSRFFMVPTRFRCCYIWAKKFFSFFLQSHFTEEKFFINGVERVHSEILIWFRSFAFATSLLINGKSIRKLEPMIKLHFKSISQTIKIVGYSALKIFVLIKAILLK